MTPSAALSDSAVSDRRAWRPLFLLLLISVVVTFITTNIYDSGDSIKHYLFARCASQYPMNHIDS